jgi:hypothetical protein
MIEALVIDAANFDRASEIAGFGNEGVLIPEAVEVDLRLKRTSFIPL